MKNKRLTFALFMVVCISVFCALGLWQIKRLHWKEGLIARLDAAYAEAPAPPFVTQEEILSLSSGHFLRGMFRGHLDFPNSFELSGQIDDGKSTKHIVVPYIISSDVTILVDFGSDFSLKEKNNANTILTGLLRVAPEANPFTPSNSPEKNIWYSIDAQALKITNLRPFLLLPEHTPWKDYPAKKPQLVNNHFQYACFWFSMAAVIAGLTVYYLKRPVA